MEPRRSLVAAQVREPVASTERSLALLLLIAATVIAIYDVLLLAAYAA